MMVGTMAEGAIGACFACPLEVCLRSPSKCRRDRPGGPGWSGGSGVVDLGGPLRPRFASPRLPLLRRLPTLESTGGWLRHGKNDLMQSVRRDDFG
jgi:hypothetical protein